MTEARFCPNCGQAAEGAKFCAACGTKLGAAAEPDAPAQHEDASAKPDPKAESSKNKQGKEKTSAGADESAVAAETDRDETAESDQDDTTEPVMPAAQPPATQPPGEAMPAAYAQQPAPAAPARGGSRWLPFVLAGAAVIIIGAGVAILLVALGGSPAKSTHAKALAKPTVPPPGPAEYVSSPRRQYTAMLPAGWVPQRISTNSILTDAMAAQGPKPDLASISIGQLPARHGSLQKIAKSLQKRIVAGADATSSEAVQLPGPRNVWAMVWDARGQRHVAYLTKACGRLYLIRGAGPARSFAQLQQRFQVTAGSLLADCS